MRRVRWSLVCCLLGSLLGSSSLARAKDKINPADYPESVTVVSARVVTEDAGTTISHNPACDNPQGPFMKGFCAQSGTEIHNRTRQHIEVIAVLGQNRYTLTGNKLPPPGPYKARLLDDGSIELMGPSANGELHVHQFKVIAIEKIDAKD
jgi:hypothetical protein